MFGPSTAVFATGPHDLHRRRRALLAPFFTKAAVRKNLEPMIIDKVERLSERIQEAAGGPPLALGHAYAAFAF